MREGRWNGAGREMNGGEDEEWGWGWDGFEEVESSRVDFTEKQGRARAAGQGRAWQGVVCVCVRVRVCVCVCVVRYGMVWSGVVWCGVYCKLKSRIPHCSRARQRAQTSVPRRQSNPGSQGPTLSPHCKHRTVQ